MDYWVTGSNKVNILSTEKLEIDARAEDLTEEFSVHGTSIFSSLAVFKSRVSLLLLQH